MAKAFFKFAERPAGAVVIDTTQKSGVFRYLSPFVLPAPPAKLFENLWQFSKVYKQHLGVVSRLPTEDYYNWRDKGYTALIPYRYPMGKGAVPEYTLWRNKNLGYIDARKQLYATEYAKNVQETESFKQLQQLYDKHEDTLILLDFDAYDHQALGMSLIDVINNPKRKMGHAFVLLMMLEGCLEECIELTR